MFYKNPLNGPMKFEKNTKFSAFYSISDKAWNGEVFESIDLQDKISSSYQTCSRNFVSKQRHGSLFYDVSLLRYMRVTV